MKQSAVWVTSISLAAMMSLAPRARADDKSAGRAPLVVAKLRTTELRVDRYNKVEKVVRMRHEGKASASFTAEPMLIDQGAVMLFEIRSVSKKGAVSRWRCIAQNDVAECLGTPVTVRWLEGEDRMILTAVMKPLAEAPDTTGLASN
jgi:hypothetical protein